eukprot:gb/GECG01012413.1/.p1 GENE.gb/GECG01012413.1/~~gb/GECG01012413.1/.p1  ORF type:complete len:2289 (+),score=217.89 gb/GECG01012413.1/:1-6867(+)
MAALSLARNTYQYAACPGKKQRKIRSRFRRNAYNSHGRIYGCANSHHRVGFVLAACTLSAAVFLAPNGNCRDGSVDSIVREDPCIEEEMSSGTRLTYQICNVTWTYHRAYRFKLKAGEVFDGQNFTVNLEGLEGDFKGMFEVSDEIRDYDNAPLIRNVHIIGGSVAINHGFVVRGRQEFFKVERCSSTGKISGKASGGIAGSNSGRNGGKIVIQNSHSTGSIVGDHAGGIVGEKAGNSNGTVTVTDCSSTGQIEGDDTGGICGKAAGVNGGNVFAQHSSSTGTVTGFRAGGVVGGLAGKSGGSVHILQSHSSGDIGSFDGGLFAGGICGGEAGFNGGEVIVHECHSTGIVKYRSGGILGGEGSGEVRISRSYSTGIIQGKYSGGICGEQFGNTNITKCFSTGEISGEGSGGIIGRNSKSVHIAQCFSRGKIIGDGAGGICGKEGGDVEITDSYSTGNVAVEANNAGGICGGDTGKDGGRVVIKNAYVLSTRSTIMIGKVATDNYVNGGLVDEGAKRVIIENGVHGTSDGITGASFMVGENHGHPSLRLTRNSGNLTVIRGQLYHAEEHGWSCDTWFIPMGDPESTYPQLRTNPQLECRDVIEKCQKCPALQFWNSSSSACEVCPSGNVPTDTQTGCRSCSPHQYATRRDCRCRECGPGKVPNANQTGCRGCHPHQFASMFDFRCKNCGPGKIPNVTQDECQDCMDHQYSTELDSECHECGPGKIPNGNRTDCVQCAPYQFATTLDSECRECRSEKIPNEQQNGCTARPSPTPTSSPSRTATPTCSGTPSRSSSPTFTPTATPSSIHLSSSTEDISSGCGDKHRFNCGTTTFKTAVNVDEGTSAGENVTGGQMNISIQSAHGEEPKLQTACSDSYVGGTELNSLYFGCAERFQKTGLASSIPVQPVMKLISNHSCEGRQANNPSCRQYEYGGSFALQESRREVTRKQLAITAATTTRMRSLESQSGSILLPLQTIILLEGEILLQTSQNFTIAMENVTALSHEGYTLSVEPHKLYIPISRKKDDQENVTKPILFTVASGVKVQWMVPESIHSFTETPDDEVFEDLQGIVALEKNISVKTDSAPAGVTFSSLYVRFFNVEQEPLKTVAVELVLNVTQAKADVETLFVKEAQSVTDSEVQRPFRLLNYGSLGMTWTVELLSSSGNPVNRTDDSWIALSEYSGQTFPMSTSELRLKFSPQNVRQLGGSSAWMRITTDAWINDAPAFDGSLSDSLPHAFQSSETGTGNFWIFVEYVVSSVFTCREYPEVISLRPLQRKSFWLSIVNTERQGIQVSFDQILLEKLNETSLLLMNKSSVLQREVIQPPQGRSNSMQIGKWLRIFPRAFYLSQGATMNVRIVLSYPKQTLSFPVSETKEDGVIKENRNLERGTYDVELGFAVFLQRNGFSYRLAERLVFSHALGAASASTSFAKLEGLTEEVGKTLNGYIQLLDVFGSSPATAQLITKGTCTSDGPLKWKTTHPPLCIFARPSSGHIEPPIEVEYPAATTSGDIISSFAFQLRLQRVGNSSLHIYLGNAPVLSTPALIEVQPEQCVGEGKTIVGGECKCMEGYRGETEECVPCDPGEFQPEPSNTDTCRACAKGYFSEYGSSSCTACPERGMSCSTGVPKLKDGVWCELCVQQELPRHRVIDDAVKHGGANFHECVPTDACEVNATAFVTSCTEGYEGPVCRQCAAGYSKTAGEFCGHCGSTTRNATIVTLSLLIALSVVGGFAYRAHKESTDEGSCQENGDDIACHDGTKSATSQSQLSKQQEALTRNVSLYNIKSFKHALILYIDYLQIASILHTMKISPFKGLSSWFHDATEMSSMNPAQGSAFRCLTGFGPLHVALSTMMTPILVLIAVLVISMLLEARTMTGASYNARWFRTSVWASILLLNLLYMSVAMTAVQSFQTYPKRIYGSERSELDLRLHTNSSSFILLQTVGAITFIVFCVAYPLVQTSYFLWRFSKLRTPREKFNFWKLTGGYQMKSRGFLWEIIVMLRKLMLILIAVWFPEGARQFVLTTSILILSYVQLIHQKPYIEKPIGLLQALLIMVSALNAGLGLIRVGAMKSATSSVGTSTLSHERLDIVVITIQVCFTLATLMVLCYLSPRAMGALNALFLDRLRNVRKYLQSTNCCNQLNYGRCKTILNRSKCQLPSKAFDDCSRTKKNVSTQRRHDVGEDVVKPVGGINPLQFTAISEQSLHDTNASGSFRDTSLEYGPPPNVDSNPRHLPALPMSLGQEENGGQAYLSGGLSSRTNRHALRLSQSENADEKSTMKRTFIPTKPSRRRYLLKE